VFTLAMVPSILEPAIIAYSVAIARPTEANQGNHSRNLNRDQLYAHI